MPYQLLILSRMWRNYFVSNLLYVIKDRCRTWVKQYDGEILYIEKAWYEYGSPSIGADQDIWNL